MIAYVSSHPTRPDTYAVMGVQCFTLFFITLALTACGSVHRTADVQEKMEAETHAEIRSAEQTLISLFDSISTSKEVEAESLEWIFFEAQDTKVQEDSTDGKKARQEQAAVRPSSVLKIKGIRSNTRTDKARTASVIELTQDTSSLHRFRHEDLARSNIEEKGMKPPDIIRNLAFLTIAIAILLSLILFAVDRWKKV